MSNSNGTTVKISEVEMRWLRLIIWPTNRWSLIPTDSDILKIVFNDISYPRDIGKLRCADWFALQTAFLFLDKN